MALYEYTPTFAPGESFPMTALVDVKAGQCLSVTGNELVSPTSGPDGAFVGFAVFDAKAGERITVRAEGICTFKATGAIAFGQRVTTAAAGTVAALSGTAYDTVIGVALAAAAGGVVKVKLIRG